MSKGIKLWKEKNLNKEYMEEIYDEIEDTNKVRGLS